MKLAMVALAVALAWTGTALAQVRIDPLPVTPAMPTPVVPTLPAMPPPPPPLDTPRVEVPVVPPCRDVAVSQRDAVTGAVTTHIERVCN